MTNYFWSAKIVHGQGKLILLVDREKEDIFNIPGII
jgi:hypothetical protein